LAVDPEIKMELPHLLMAHLVVVVVQTQQLEAPL
jgi:hypothetical protein